MFKAIVIEDEIGIQEFIINLLRRYCNDIEVLGSANSVKTGIELILRKKPNLVLLDIELKDGNAFKILDTFNKNEFVTIILTGYKNYGIDGIKYGVSDYLLKPVIVNEFVLSIEKAKNRIKELKLIKTFHKAKESKEIEGCLLVHKTNNSKTFLNFSQILYLKSEMGYTKVHLIRKRDLLLRETLKHYLEKLPLNFIKIHRSYCVNLDHVTSFKFKRTGCLTLNNGIQLPISARNKSKFLNKIDNYNNNLIAKNKRH